MLGTFILWFGWYGFNGGSTMLLDTEYYDSLAALSATNTTLSAGMAGLSALFTNMLVMNFTKGEVRHDLVYVMNGTLSGLVAITAGCGLMEPWAAVVTGFFAGIFYLLGSWLLVWIRLDDAVDAVPVHLVNGIWGLIATGLFASPTRLEQAFGTNDHPGAVYGQGGTLLGAQLVGALFILGWTLCTMAPFFLVLEYFGMFRTAAADEVVGLDRNLQGGFLAGSDGDIDLSFAELNALQKRVEHQLEGPGSNGMPINEVSVVLDNDMR
jgi:Amt family ammonium transporter